MCINVLSVFIKEVFTFDSCSQTNFSFILSVFSLFVCLLHFAFIAIGGKYCVEVGKWEKDLVGFLSGCLT